MTDVPFDTVADLDEFAAWAHAVNGTPGVQVTPAALVFNDTGTPHGFNTDDEMAGD